MDGKTFCIMSLIPQNGSKYITTNLGFFMKKKFKDKKILLIDFDFDNPTLCYHYVKNSDHSIDNLISIEKFLTKNDFLKNISKTEFEVDVLKGSNLNSTGFFSKELIVKILNISKEIYDYIFVVANFNINNSATIMTLLNSDKIILVVRNNYSNLLKINKKIEELNTFIKDKSIIKIIANYNDYEQEIDVLKKIENYNYLSLLDCVSKSVDNKNLQEKSLIKRKTINDRKFKEIIEKIIR